jgi:hypothetical protein
MMPSMETTATTQPIAADMATIRVPALSKAKARRRVSTASVADRAGAAWETLGYAVIWLCGLTGIVLCFL